jgi:hypothetical protein
LFAAFLSDVLHVSVLCIEDRFQLEVVEHKWISRITLEQASGPKNP